MNRSSQGIPDENILDLRSRDSQSSVPEELPTPDERETSSRRQQRQRESVSFLHHITTPEHAVTSAQETDTQLRESKEKKRGPLNQRNLGKPFIVFITSRVSYASLGVFVLLLLLVAGVFSSIGIVQNAREAKGRVLGATTEGFTSLQKAEQALLVQDTPTLLHELQQAEQHFDASLREIQSLEHSYGILLSLVGVKDELETGESAVRAGRSASRLGLLLQDFVTEAQEDGASGYIGFMDAYQRFGAPIRLELGYIEAYLNAVHDDKLPGEYQALFASAKQKFSRIGSALTRADTMLTIFSDVLGFHGERTHLVLFQNNQELRATGGFIGSVARMSVTEGAITALEVPKGGSYDISGQVKSKFKAPRPLQVVNPYFSFQDANWFADFQISAKKILELYYDAGNPSVEGVIAFTPDVLLDLLHVTGPVQLEKTVQVSVDEDNFLRVIRDAIEEEKNDASTEPKKIIAELMPTLLEEAFSLPLTDQLSIAFLLDEGLQQKDILLYATDPTLQQQITQAGFGGTLTIPEAYDDYLALVSSNIAGGKTDRFIEQHVTIHTTLEHGHATNAVTVTRTHTGTKQDVYSGTTNLSYVRSYVPGGAKFITADGFYDVPDSLYQEPPREIATDEDLANEELQTVIHEATGTRMLDMEHWTVFGNWMRTQAGETTQTTFEYTLPDRSVDDETWSTFFQKQPGGHTTYVTWIISADRRISGADSSLPSHAVIEDHEAAISFELTDDVIVGVTFN